MPLLFLLVLIVIHLDFDLDVLTQMGGIHTPCDFVRAARIKFMYKITASTGIQQRRKIIGFSSVVQCIFVHGIDKYWVIRKLHLRVKNTSVFPRL